MDIKVKDKVNQRHVGRNLQRIRVYLGMKQEALASDLGVSQQEISKIEKQDEIEDGLLTKIAEVLGISTDVIKDFDVEKAICNINNYKFIYIMSDLVSLTVVNGEIDFDLINRLKLLKYLNVSYSNIVNERGHLKLNDLEQLYINNTSISNFSYLINLINLKLLSVDEKQYKNNLDIINKLKERNVDILSEGILSFEGDTYE